MPATASEPFDFDAAERTIEDPNVPIAEKVRVRDDAARAVQGASGGAAEHNKMIDEFDFQLGAAATLVDHANAPHEIEGYLHLLDGNPRSIVRFANRYSFLKLSRDAARIDSDAIARWCALALRWPLIAQRLRSDPALLERFHNDGTPQDDPDRELFGKESFQRVVLTDDRRELALTAEAVQGCIGI